MRLDDVLYGVRSSGCRTHMSTWPSAASVRVHTDSYKASGVPFLEFFYDCGRRRRILSRVRRWRRLCTRRQVQYVFTRMPACPHIAPHSAREIEIPAFNCSRERPNTARMRVCAQAGRSSTNNVLTARPAGLFSSSPSGYIIRATSNGTQFAEIQAQHRRFLKKKVLRAHTRVVLKLIRVDRNSIKAKLVCVCSFKQGALGS